MGWSTSDAGDGDIWGNRPGDILGKVLGGDVHGNAAGDLWGNPFSLGSLLGNLFF